VTGAENPFQSFVERYYDDPSLLVREVLGAEPEPYQDDVMRAVARGDRKISVRSGHGVGKTTVLAWIVVWFILTRFPQKTVCTAPTSAQLFDALQKEIVTWLKKLSPPLLALLEIKSERIELIAAPEESYISFRTSRPEMPEALAGVHSDNVLLVCDEASGIPEQVFIAASGSMSGYHATQILAGNPVRSSGLFYDSHHKLRGDWTTFVISCLNSKRVTPEFAPDMAKRYGEKSNAYRVRVLGEFPLADDDKIIPFELMEAALRRDVVPFMVKPIWGLDCARFGMDASALAKRRGNVLAEPTKEWGGLDLMELVGRVKYEWDTTPPSDRPSDICVDAIGLGAGAADRLRELGLPARAINVSESASMKEHYLNLRAELWFKGREWLAARDCNLAGDEELGAQLIRVKYKITSNGKQQAEGKDELKKRGFDSPNRADAFLLTLAVDAVSATHGTIHRISWATPLRRAIKGIT